MPLVTRGARGRGVPIVNLASRGRGRGCGRGPRHKNSVGNGPFG